MFEKNLEVGLLLDFYGDILPERRREMIELYHPQSIKDIQEMLKHSEYQCRYSHKTVFHSDSALSVF